VTPSRGYVLYAITLIFLVAVFNVVDRYVISILAASIQQDLGISDTQMGLLLGPSFSIVHFIAVLPAAWLADRTARRSVIAAGLFVWSAMTAFGGLAQSFTQIFLARMGVGIGEAAGSPPSVGLLTDTAPEAWRARALSVLSMGALVGIAAGMIAGGFMAERYGWRNALLVLGFIGMGLALLVRLTLREPPRSSAAGASPLSAARHLFGFSSFRWTVIAACLVTVCSSGRSLWEPSFIARAYGYSLAEVGFAYVMISAIPAIFGAYTGSAIADRLGRRDPRWLAWSCALGNGLACPFLIAFLVWPPEHVISIGGLAIPVAFLFSTAGSFFIGFYSPPTAAIAQGLATPQMRSLAHGLWTMVATLVGMGMGPLAVGLVSDGFAGESEATSLMWGLIAITAIAPLSAIAYLIASRNLREDLRRAAEQAGS
jgi:MFS family permease